MTKADLKDILLKIDFLDERLLTDDDLNVASFKKGEYLYDSLDGIPSIAILLCGVASVYHETLSGKLAHLNDIGRGSLFGISNLAKSSELETSIRAKSDVTLLYIPKKRVIEMLESNGRLALRYALYCNEKINFLISKIEYFTLSSSKDKLAAYLLINCDENGRIYLEGSRDELALRVDVSRAALFRELKVLQENNLIEVLDNLIVIRDEGRLRSILREKG